MLRVGAESVGLAGERPFNEERRPVRCDPENDVAAFDAVVLPEEIVPPQLVAFCVQSIQARI